MTFNWENIRYLFQIPVDWFKTIHDRVFKAFGSNFIVVKEDSDSGGMHIDVDEDSFVQAVRNAAPVGVLTVDDIGPDVSGNVDLSGYVESVNGISPDLSGNVELSGYVETINGNAPDSNGEISVAVGVLTINGTSPDADGNININVDTTSCLMQTDWMNASSNYSVCPYVYSNIVYNGNLPAGVTNLYTWTGALTYPTLDDCITDLGYAKDDDLGDLAYLDTVEVDGHTSDASGSISFGLTGGKWVKTDASGHLATTNDTPISIDTSQYTPVSISNKKVITDVTWNGTTLKYSSENWTYVNGVLVSRSTNSDTTIDTPVAY